MMGPDDKHEAACACGQLRVEVSGDPEMVVACNCTCCQRRTGSPFGLGAYYRRAQLVAVHGTAKAFDRRSDSGRLLSTNFCPDCGTSVYWTLELRPDHVAVAIGCFADPGFRRPDRAVWAESQHHWLRFPDNVPVFQTTAG